MPALKPGILTTEWWATILVHLLSGTSIGVAVSRISWHHISLAQTLVPIVALAMSTIAQSVYNDGRLRLKLEHLVQTAKVEAVRLALPVPVISPPTVPAPTAPVLVVEPSPSVVAGLPVVDAVA